MKVYINANHEIKDVGSTQDETLTEVVIADDTNPFRTWSNAKICCYKVDVVDGVVTMMTPYIDTRLIPHIEHIADDTEEIGALMNEIEDLCNELIGE